MNKRAHDGHGRHAAGRGAGDWQDEAGDLHTRGPAVAWSDWPAHHRDVEGGDGHHALRHGDDDTRPGRTNRPDRRLCRRGRRAVAGDRHGRVRDAGAGWRLNRARRGRLRCLWLRRAAGRGFCCYRHLPADHGRRPGAALGVRRLELQRRPGVGPLGNRLSRHRHRCVVAGAADRHRT